MLDLNNKHIVFVTGSLELGGSERQLLHLARHLKNCEGASVEVWGFSGPGRLCDLCDSCGIPWKIAPNPLAGTGLRRLVKTVRFLQALRRARPDVLMPYTTVPNIACGLYWKLSAARLCVWNQRDSGVERYPAALENKAARRTPLFISNSQHGADFLAGALGIRPGAIRVVRNGIALAGPEHGRQHWRELLGAADTTFLACMVANLSRNKDHLTLLRAWRRVVDDLSADGTQCLLALAGRFDDMESAAKALAFDLDLGRHVRFLGGVKDIAGLLAAADLGVFSSRAEGSPNGVLECMAAGLPVAATDIPGIREIVPPEQARHLAPAGDSDALARIIAALARDAGLRGSLGRGNRERVAGEFAVERMCRETAALLRGHCV